MSESLPTNLSEWEAALTRRFLMVTGNDATPIRSFDICRETLAEAVGCSGDAADPAVDSFKNALMARRATLFEALERGSFLRHSSADCLGCFAYLALTVYVDSQVDADDEGGAQFRSKLADFLGVERSFSDLHGVHDMWERLRDWLALQSRKGKPFRRLVLPRENGWTHIGYSTQLSFPSRKDRTFLTNFFADHPGIAADESQMLAHLRNLIKGTRASPGLKFAFDEFYAAYSAGQRSLANHRFWSFVRSVARSDGVRLPIETHLHLVFGEDDVPVYSVDLDEEQNNRELFNDLGSAIARVQAMGRSNLSRALDAGFLVFSRVGHARWLASPSFEDCRGSVHVALSPNVATVVGSKLGRFVPSGSWSITEKSVLVGRAEEALERLLPRSRPPDIHRPSIDDGVRVGSHWLGRPRVLPSITAEGGSVQLLHQDASERPVCEELAGRPNVYNIKSQVALDGVYTVRSASCAPLSLRFVRNSFIHTAAQAAGGMPVREWTAESYLTGRCAAAPTSWQEVPPNADDLIEAIYAGGRAGWDEFELMPLLQRVLPESVNAWDYLRALHESSVLVPRLRAQFRGRVWTLGEPSLVSLGTDSGHVVVVDGCVGALLADDFRTAVLQMGGSPFRRVGTEWGVPVLGAAGVEVGALAARLRWKQSRAFMPSERIAALSETERSLEPYEAASYWSWELGRFTLREDRASVQLTRWVHRGGRDHDVYEVVVGARTRRFLSRAVAVACAHMMAKRPLFEAIGGALVRTAKDGFLPDVLARWLRYVNLAAPIILPEGGYRYPASSGQAARIAALLPGAVNAPSRFTPAEEIVSSVRRSGWASRLVWTDSGLSAGRSPFECDIRSGG